MRQWERTQEQDDFLKAKIPLFLSAQSEGSSKGKVFAAGVIEEWHAHWPKSRVLYPETSPDDPPLNDEQKLHRAKAVAAATEKRRKVYVPQPLQ